MEENLYFELTSEINRLEKELEIKHDAFMVSTEELCECSETIDKAIKIIESYNIGKYDYCIPNIGVIELLEVLEKNN